MNIWRNKVKNTNNLKRVFIGNPTPPPITFEGVVPSSWNELSLERMAFRVFESSNFTIDYLVPASEGQNHFQCSGIR